MWYLDANVLVRLYTQSDPDVHRRCSELIDECVRGDIELGIDALTVAEVVYVLGSPRLYGQARQVIAEVLQSILGIPGLRIEGREEVELAAQFYSETNLDFADCFAGAASRLRGWEGVVSLDKGLDRLTGIVRREP